MRNNDRYALLIGVSTYDNEHYHDLPAVRADLHYMQAVLQSTEIGQYNDCDMVPDPTRAEMLHAIESFLEERQQSESALLYFSGHGEFSEADNQLYFLTRDSDPADLPRTAVSAEFLERTLQSCRAASKIVLLDCCASGSVVQGWHAKGRKGADSDEAEPSTLLHPTGVYFITASDALQAASAMAPEGSTLGTSRFTGEIVEGLRNGRIKDSGWISPEDLFEYLTTQMVRKGVPEEQRPTKSTIRATHTLHFARSVASPVHLPSPPHEPPPPSAAHLKARERVAADRENSNDWQRLLRYYAQCLNAQAAASMLPDRRAGRNTQYFLIDEGPETVQSGLSPALPAPKNLPGAHSSGGTTAKNGSGRAADQHEYWYGYPAITLPSRGEGSRGTDVGIAPLLIQQMELAPDESGRAVLRPSGVPSLHTKLVTEVLSEDEAAQLLARWQPTWQHGNDAQMIKAVRELLDVLGLPELEPLDASALSGDSVNEALRPGAHNAAVILAPSSVERFASDGVVENLLAISTRKDEIPGTALDALLNGGNPAPTTDAILVVSAGPFNESQEQVVVSAMTQPLTVATGPPGTGKSEVVTSVVATCVAAGESVLVASTNNEAVNVVAQRCDDIAPGLLMRTGNVEALVKEAEKLEQLLSAPPAQPARSSATVAGQLRNLRSRAAALRDQAARQVEGEVRLAQMLSQRADLAGKAELPVASLSRLWQSGDLSALARWETRARRAAAAGGWWGRWRRTRAMKVFVTAAGTDAAVQLPPWAAERPVASDLLDDLADLTGLERQVRDLTPAQAAYDEEAVRQARSGCATTRAQLSAELCEAMSAEVLDRGRSLLDQRLQTLRQRKGTQRSQLNLLRHLKGWAITTHAVRQLRPDPKLFDLVVIDEASQCSIAAVLPLLFRARRALIIGDPMQLTHIPGISPEQERQARVRAGLSAAWLEDRRLAYHVHSSYHAAAQNGESALLLDEHYRCHPEIAEIVNGHCYSGALELMTDVRRQIPAIDLMNTGEGAPVLAWAHVPSGESARGPGGKSWRNPSEGAAVADIVRALLRRLPESATVGVVTPFRAQKDALESMIGSDRVRVGTVHAFQGGQRDVMILSPVATTNTPQRTAHWVTSQVSLWNVAITRAKSQLITVGNHAYWQQETGLPHLLSSRSLLWDPGQTTSRRPTPAPEPRLRQGRHRRDLTDTVQQVLAADGVVELERDALVGGQRIDLLFTASGGNTAVVVDTGPGPDRDPARHLRLVHERAGLLVGLPSGGRGAKAGPVTNVVRIPAWRILAGPNALAPLFD
ncbi:caspase, EACC1-associated type [Streptomyces sp. PTY087I2]|uniref:caspase, EACC1-associated type n=1 Tax=Streptomyces sp. PTY087I2 TaxID=1819298 RepID=UPI00080BB327|nr:AAA domain-containing protein [Streptomyces sp. PTY087I2]OCC12505.1 ATP-dependent RecD-like DNA helicase [Streptomyces sp. PTY087I2]